MEEIVSLIYNGCRLARDLEVNLPNIANQPEMLWNNCEEIIRIFTDTRDRINAQFGGGSQGEDVGAMQQWLRYTPQIVQQQEGGSEGAVVAPSEAERWAAGGRGDQLQPVEGAARGATFQRTRRREEDAERRIIRVPAPQIGNTEIPPEDGFTWRKYGQKEILGSRFPRAYYRCTHQKLYNCPAKKQVQRLADDPFTFEVIYRGDHTCTVSSTAPSMSALPENTEASRVMFQQAAGTMSSSQLLHSSTTTSVLPGSQNWLSMRTQPAGLDATNTNNPFVNMHMFSNISGMVESSSGVAGPSTMRDAGDQYYEPLAEFVDVMFNSGTSSNSNMDHIFSADIEDHKWDSGEDKQD
ncbi:hypothetical protein DCAR_0626292 [Daucus carota subsp. sativus]|uniref:WRKY domain-containing protein n=1 Tax=Daucus carota subsp. sativus TaxID=79200 RepID=A0A161ZWF9_DAUCS|nr:PREDICTED: WRKY transcription factor 55 [Daucus carota subsp. sativus]WOH06863.1 hypothetical protein DCAR_0626292 [Daucus carota subsp. sativus]